MMTFNLIELTPGPWQGEILRSEEMTEEQAAARNAEMSGTIIEWQAVADTKGGSR